MGDESKSSVPEVLLDVHKRRVCLRYVRKLRLEVYHCNVSFIITDEAFNEYKRLCRKHKVPVEVGEFEGRTEEFDSGFYMIIDLKYLTHNTISHEISHMVDFIAEPRSVFEKEARAWLSGFLAGELYKFLDKKNLQVKHA